MPRYIDADNIKLKGIAVLDENLDFLVSLSDVRKSLQMTPTADVVPRAEVDELICKLECLLCHATGGRLSKHTYDFRTMETVVTDCINETYNDGFGEGYKECAMEIFEEIEELFKIVKIPCVNEDGCITPLQAGYWAIDPEDYAKFKQRFTEGGMI